MKICESIFEYVGNPLYKMIMPWKPVFGGYIGTVFHPSTKHQCQYVLQTPALRASSLK
jgi:hypothetical protein